MYKVLIVDDEAIICQGLKDTLPWGELNVEVIGVAHDGEEALELIEKTDVDLIISDVKMPIMDGLELAMHIYNRYPEIKMIMISGFDEFEYAQRAMKYKVRDYLLKPVNIEELMELVKSLKKETFKEKTIEWRSSIQQSLANIMTDKETTINQHSTTALLSNGYRLLSSEIKKYSETILNLSEDEKNKIKMLWAQQLDNELLKREILSTSVFIRNNRLITCCNIGVEDEETIYLLNDVVVNVSKQIGFNIRLCVSPSSNDGEQLGQLLQRINAEVFTKHMRNKNVICATENTVSIQSNQMTIDEMERKFISINQLDETNIAEYTNKVFQYFVKNDWCLADIVRVLREVEEKLFHVCEDELAFDLLNGIELDVYNSISSLKKLFLKDMYKYFSFRENLSHNSQQILIKQAMAYMRDHFSSDLKASEVANVINISPNYFSQLMKQETGYHFNDYLHHLRITEAKKLLEETPYRILEIAEIVGYKDYKYFVHIFKKIINFTPTQYRNMKNSNIVV